VNAAPPSGRTLAGIAILLLAIVLLAVAVAVVSPVVGAWPVLIQALFYVTIVAAWTMSLKMLVRWMVTGRLRAPGRVARD
jgi:hypothetical protein